MNILQHWSSQFSEDKDDETDKKSLREGYVSYSYPVTLHKLIEELCLPLMVINLTI